MGQSLVRAAVRWDGTAEQSMLNSKELIKVLLESVQPLTFRALPYRTVPTGGVTSSFRVEDTFKDACDISLKLREYLVQAGKVV